MTPPPNDHLLTCLEQAILLLAKATDLPPEEALAIVQERAQMPPKLRGSSLIKDRIVTKLAKSETKALPKA